MGSLKFITVCPKCRLNRHCITKAIQRVLVIFNFHRRWQRYWLSCAFKFSLFLLFIVLAVGEFGCFWWAFCTWRIPKTSRDSLNLLFVSDSQIQGYKGERPGILGSIARLDSDWYLTKAFFLALSSFSADAVIHLGDLLDEGYIATDDEFQEYKVRHDKIFNTPDRISRIHVAGDNDIGGESRDIITEKTVSRFSENFGPINDILRLKSLQIVKINSLSFLRRWPLRDEQTNYNNTMNFIKELPLKLHKDKISILIGHVPLGLTNKYQVGPMMKLINAVKPRYAFSGHTHKSASFEHEIGSVVFTEYVVPTCSYRMGTDKIGAAVAVIDVDGSIDFSVLPLPTRYPFFYAYLVVLCVCVTLALLILFILRPCFNGIFNRRRIQFISVGRNATFQCC
ncbi:metallophosphoesterase 1 homolog [Orbicella faveolata]|uniref:metallophosphoesterase 1 homolog n=1 Tax=Orbicella faveolata TaxID=48498 RepID=UPI0009E257DE|nr:metallophosphoesterase 1 homolog [Orbicella faveolata]